ncbi:MAG: hypothetical protein ACLQU1_01715 [Bryobacteraceae bacterium]
MLRDVGIDQLGLVAQQVVVEHPSRQEQHDHHYGCDDAHGGVPVRGLQAGADSGEQVAERGRQLLLRGQRHLQ